MVPPKVYGWQHEINHENLTLFAKFNTLKMKFVDMYGVSNNKTEINLYHTDIIILPKLNRCVNINLEKEHRNDQIGLNAPLHISYF